MKKQWMEIVVEDPTEPETVKIAALQVEESKTSVE